MMLGESSSARTGAPQGNAGGVEPVRRVTGLGAIASTQCRGLVYQYLGISATARSRY